MTSDLGDYFEKLLDVLCENNRGLIELETLRKDFKQDREIAFLNKAAVEEMVGSIFPLSGV